MKKAILATLILIALVCFAGFIYSSKGAPYWTAYYLITNTEIDRSPLLSVKSPNLSTSEAITELNFTPKLRGLHALYFKFPENTFRSGLDKNDPLFKLIGEFEIKIYSDTQLLHSETISSYKRLYYQESKLKYYKNGILTYLNLPLSGFTLKRLRLQFKVNSPDPQLAKHQDLISLAVSPSLDH